MTSSDDDDYITTHFYITCSICGNTKAYVWFDKRIREYLIGCDNCGVKEVSGGPKA